MITEFEIVYNSRDEFNLRYSINFQKLQIELLNVEKLPGPIPDGDPDRRCTVRVTGDLFQVFIWSWLAAKLKNSVSLS